MLRPRTMLISYTLCAEVTGKIKEFLQGAPEQIATGLEYVANQINDTVGFFQYMKSTAFGITEHLVDNFRDLESLSKSECQPGLLWH